MITHAGNRKKSGNWRKLLTDDELTAAAKTILNIIEKKFPTKTEELIKFIKESPAQTLFNAFYALYGDAMPSYGSNHSNSDKNYGGQVSLGEKLRSSMLAALNSDRDR